MLILTRRIGESIRISDDIVVTVQSIKGNQVRIGIDAPPALSILREELVHRPIRAWVEEAAHRQETRILKLAR